MILVLLVDDEPPICNLAKQFLEQSQEMTVDTVFSAQEALQFLDQKAYDVIVSDYQMPGMDGIQLLKSLRSTGVRIPFILFTGKGREEVVIEALNNGADSYLQKGGNVRAQFAELGNAITQAVNRRRAEDTLRLNEEKLRLITDNTRDTLWLMDMQMRTTWISPSVFRTRGYTLEELASMPLDRHLTPQSLQKVTSAMSTLLTQENLLDPTKELSFADELEYYRKDGTTFWADTVTTLLRNELGQPTGFVSVGRDVTERKRVEEALRESEKRYRLLVDSAAEAIVVLQDGMIKLGNPITMEVVGYSEQELKSRPFPSFIHPDDRAMVVERHQMRMKGEAVPDRYAFRVLAKDGSVRWTEISAVLIEWEGRPATLNFMTDITERKRTEEALLEAQERFKSLHNQLLECVYISDFEGNFLDANPATLELLGYTAEEITSLNFGSLLDSTQLPKAIEAIDEIKRTGVQKQLNEFRLRCKNGEYVDVETCGSILYHQGKPYAIQGIARDITGRKRAEKILQASERMLADIIDFLPDATFVVDLEGRVVAWNQAIEKMSGVSKEDMIGQGDHAFSIPFYGTRRRQLLDLLILDEEEIRQKYDYVTWKGNTLYAEAFCNALNGGKGAHVWAFATSIFDDQGIRVGAIESIRDITERKRAEEALRESEKKYRLLVESAAEAILVAQDGMLRLVNPMTVAITGFSEQELMSRPFPSFIHPDDRAMVVERHQTRLKGEAVPNRYAFRVQAKDGSVKWVEISAITIEWEGRPATLNFLTDITERKAIERAFEDTNRKLQLMTSITRHDILNQIMSLRGFLELANDSQDPLKANKLRKKALEVTRSIESMIEFTRDYQEIGVREPVWHNVRAAVDTLDSSLMSQGLRLENQVPEVEILADPMVIKVLQNLADNSARHGMHAKLVRFSSKTEGGTLKILCEDDGVGIPVNAKSKIFERGYGNHTGLGLHFAREVLHITGIDIEENGEPGKGACFVISVPNGRWRYAGENKK